MEPTVSGTTDHEDSRQRLASSLSADLSCTPGAERQREEHFNLSVIGRRRFHDTHQQDPCQRSYPSEEVLVWEDRQIQVKNKRLEKLNFGSPDVELEQPLSVWRNGRGYGKKCQPDLNNTITAPWSTWCDHAYRRGLDLYFPIG